MKELIEKYDGRKSGSAHVFLNLPNEEYHANKTHKSSSRLKPAFKSIRKVFNPDPVEKIDAFVIGNAFEAKLLGDVEYLTNGLAIYDERERPQPDKSFRTKENKEWKEDFFQRHSGRDVISGRDWALVERMVDETLKEPRHREVCSEGVQQLSIFWTDENGLKVKTRPDLVVKKDVKKVDVVDIKSTVDASPEGFARQAANLHYPFQAVMQIKGIEAAGYLLNEYWYLVTEKSLQCPLAIMYQLQPEDIDLMRVVYQNISSAVAHADKTGVYPGYEGRFNEWAEPLLDIPAWYRKSLSTYV